MKRKPLFLLLSLLLLSSCGYRYNESPLLSRYSSLSIPYVKGDREGELTNALIKEIALSTPLLYLSQGGELILEGEIVADHRETIGYRYDRKAVSGKRVRRLVADERRREVVFRFSLRDRSSQEIIYGPVEVSAQTDYDFLNTDSLQEVSFMNGEGGRENTLFFSLGQLDSSEGASDGAKKPLYERVARRVAEGIDSLSLPIEAP